MLKIVTMTGADDSVTPQELADMQKIFPFVEWGILFSMKHTGSARFPSSHWLQELVRVQDANPDLKLSAHLCGQYVRDFLKGNDDFVGSHIPVDVWDLFDRVQLNTHAEDHEFDISALEQRLSDHLNKQFIFQIDGNEKNQAAISEIAAMCGNVGGLHDLSHGTGILPKEWPEGFEWSFGCGYAGGLGPDNLAEELRKIHAMCISQEYWIDMETKIRDSQDMQFNLDKVKTCLSIAQPYIALQCVNTEPLKGNDIAPPLTEGKIYSAQIHFCKCGQHHYDVGLESKHNFVRCYKCQEKLPNGEKIHWAHPMRFVLA